MDFIRFRQFFFWLAVACAGQVALLLSIDAGPRIHFQHLRLPAELLRDQPLALAALCLQSALVLSRLFTIRPAVSVARWRAAVVAGTMVLTSATVSPSPLTYAAELAFAGLLALVNLGNLCLAAGAFPEAALPGLRARFRRLLEDESRRFVLYAASWVFVVCGLLNLLSYQRHPHVPDEVSCVIQARYFAAGMIAMPEPPAPEAFDLELMTIDAGKWYSPFPPGWPALLAAGYLTGTPWLVNPFLAACSLALAYALLEGMYGLAAARLGTLLLCASPWFLFMGMNFMTHTASTAFALAAGVAVMRFRRRGTPAWLAGAGAASSAVGYIRPLEGAIVILLLGCWLVRSLPPRRAAAAVTLFAAAAGLCSLPHLAYNKRLTGSATTFPVMYHFDKYFWPKSNALGFGPERGFGWPLDPYRGHSPRDGVINANLSAFGLNTELFGWASGSLWLLAAFLVSGRCSASDRAMLAVMAAVFTAQFFYWYHGGPEFGARYWYLMLVPCVALSVRGVEALEEAGIDRGRVLAAVGVAAVMAVVIYLPWRAVDKYRHFLYMRPDVREMARSEAFGNGLVFIRGQRHPDYASAAVYNPIGLKGPGPVYALDKDPAARARTMKAFPGRRVWILDGPTRTGRGFRISARPETRP
jgi:hypothetical protein